MIRWLVLEPRGRYPFDVRLLFPIVLLLSACGDDEQAVDDTGVLEAIDEACVDAAVVTYASFGESFLLHNCQGCHASTAPDRYGAPEEATFDDVEQAGAWADRILARAAGEYPSMPPEGGVDADDRTRLTWWLLCAEEGT